MNTCFSKNRIILILPFFILFCLPIAINAQVLITQKAQDDFVCTEDKDMVVGTTTLDAISKNNNFWVEYLFLYERHNIDKETIEQLTQLLSDRTIKVVAVIGTWCSDSKIHFPVFSKVMQHLPQNAVSTEIIGTDRDKLAGDTDIFSLNIEFVPTFIFYENKTELGRIVEAPSETMEKDILKILSNK